SAAYYNVIFSMADTINARHFPMPLPVLVSSAKEREVLHNQSLVKIALELGAEANAAFVGVGELGPDAPLCEDGFLAREEMAQLMAQGAAGEICGWTFDHDGALLAGSINERVASIPLPPRDRASVIGIAKGTRKYAALRAALKGRIINGLITDEATAEYLLKA
ncbi:MAG TPA: sugar-binding domain-containing protein, partial [Sinorhizobium sp.]|nr:sugar-binding domain-containing protein [Sinorhizobium sp.]